MKRHDFSQIFTNFARTMGNIAKNVDEQIDLLQSRGMIQKTFFDFLSYQKKEDSSKRANLPLVCA